jgi:hypothetical protein
LTCAFAGCGDKVVEAMTTLAPPLIEMEHPELVSGAQ